MPCHLSRKSETTANSNEIAAELAEHFLEGAVSEREIDADK